MPPITATATAAPAEIHAVRSAESRIINITFRRWLACFPMMICILQFGWKYMRWIRVIVREAEIVSTREGR
jgi:hypothetical protein